MSPVHSLELVFLGLMIAVAAVSGIARRLGLSYPIVLVVVGLGCSLIPGVPHFPLPPDVVFLVFLPPLLYAAAWQTSWREFKYNIISISMLAGGLVMFTAVGVALTAHYFLPGFDWRLGFLLGAIASPTDAVAASTIAKKLTIPQRLIDILEGESLLNDATGLLALEFGVDMIVHGTVPSVTQGALRLVWLIVGGNLVGLAVGYLTTWLERWIDDGPVEIVISLIVPYVAYLGGEGVHASGVIAVVVCGLFVSRKSASFFSSETRLQAWSFWEAIEFLLNGLIFILLGLQLPNVVSGLNISRGRLILYGAVFSGVLVALRMIWVYPGAQIAFRLRRLVQKQQLPRPHGRSVFVLGWIGMRGVVALAAAGSLPFTTADGSPFPQRNLIIFLTFSVIIVTLVVQGVTLVPLIRLLGLKADTDNVCEEGEARRILLRAAIDTLQQGRSGQPEHEHQYDDLIHQYQHRLEDISDCVPGTVQEDESAPSVVILRNTLRVEREVLNSLRDEGRIGDTLHRQIQRELDLTESKLAMM